MYTLSHQAGNQGQGRNKNDMGRGKKDERAEEERCGDDDGWW